MEFSVYEYLPCDHDHGRVHGVVWLHLVDGGAQLAQHPAAVGAGEHVGEVYHHEAFTGRLSLA